MYEILKTATYNHKKIRAVTRIRLHYFEICCQLCNEAMEGLQSVYIYVKGFRDLSDILRINKSTYAD